MIALITCIVFIICCSYIGTISLKKYVSHSKNYEYVFYWGLSFILFGLGFALYMIQPLITNPYVLMVIANLIHMTDTFAWALQLYAVVYITLFCYRYDTRACKHCKVCKRKLTRIILFLSCIVIIICAYALGLATQIDIVDNTVQIMGLQLTGSTPLDIYYEIIHASIAVVIAVLLARYRKFKIHLYFSFALVAIAEIMKLSNIIFMDYTNLALQQTGWALATAAIIIMVREIKKLIDHNEREEVKKKK